MVSHLKSSSLQEVALQQVDGVVRQCEEGAEFFVESTIPTICKNRIHAHDSECASILFQNNSHKLTTGGQDHSIKLWDTSTRSLSHTLHGCLGHTDKVFAVDVSKVSNSHVISASYDRTIKSWDLQKGYCTDTIIFPSNCNAVCFSTDGGTICSGHVDGNLRLWDIQTSKLLSEVAAHSLAITSISLSQNGSTILTSGRDNVHNLFDIRTLEVIKTLRGNGNRLSSNNWSRSCIRADDSYVAAGSADGSVHIWSVLKGDIVSTLKEHGFPVLYCSWSGLGKPLATSDRNGVVCTWK